MASGALLFTNGQTVATFTIPILDDFLVETNETVMITLSNVVGASLIAPSSAELTITDNDTDQGGFEFPFTSPVLGGGDQRNRNRDRGPAGRRQRRCIGRFAGDPDTDRQCLFRNHQCHREQRFLAGRRHFDWNDGEGGLKSFSFAIVDDPEPELDEVFLAQLANPTGGASVSTTRRVLPVVIISDDQPAGAADKDFNPVTPLNPARARTARSLAY